MEVFPTLHLEGDCKVYMEDVRVDRVVTTRARDLLKVYISCDNIIEKEYIYKVEKELHKQLFSALEGGKEGPEVKIYETFHLSAQAFKKTYYLSRLTASDCSLIFSLPFLFIRYR